MTRFSTLFSERKDHKLARITKTNYVAIATAFDNQVQDTHNDRLHISGGLISVNTLVWYQVYKTIDGYRFQKI